MLKLLYNGLVKFLYMMKNDKNQKSHLFDHMPTSTSLNNSIENTEYEDNIDPEILRDLNYLEDCEELLEDPKIREDVIIGTNPSNGDERMEINPEILRDVNIYNMCNRYSEGLDIIYEASNSSRSIQSISSNKVSIVESRNSESSNVISINNSYINTYNEEGKKSKISLKDMMNEALKNRKILSRSL